MADKKSFVVYYDIKETLNELEDVQVGQLFRAMVTFAATGAEPVFEDKLMRLAWIPVRQALARDAGKYADLVEKRKKAGAKGGKASANARSSKTVENTKDFKQNEANEANQADNVNDNDIDNDNDNVNDNVTLSVNVNDNEPAADDGRTDRQTDGLTSFDQLLTYGVKGNVKLTEAELREVRERYQDSRKLIDKVSLWLVNAKHPNQNHLDLIHKFANNDDWPRKPQPVEKPPDRLDPERGELCTAPESVRAKLKAYKGGLEVAANG